MSVFPALPGMPTLPGLSALPGMSPRPSRPSGEGPAGEAPDVEGPDVEGPDVEEPAAEDPVEDPDGETDDPAAEDPAVEDPESPADDSDRPGAPGKRDAPAWATRPYCHERGKCGARPSHHHRPDWTRHRRCEQSTRRAHWSQHRTGRARTVAVHIDPTGRHGLSQTVRQPDAIVKYRSSGRSEHSRRSAVAERPQNVRPASILEMSYATGGHNSRRHIPEARSEDNLVANRPYRGSHRAGSLHHVDDQTPAQQRSSRVGRHHAEPTEDVSGRW